MRSYERPRSYLIVCKKEKGRITSQEAIRPDWAGGKKDEEDKKALKKKRIITLTKKKNKGIGDKTRKESEFIDSLMAATTTKLHQYRHIQIHPSTHKNANNTNNQCSQRLSSSVSFFFFLCCSQYAHRLEKAPWSLLFFNLNPPNTHLCCDKAQRQQRKKKKKTKKKNDEKI